MRAPVTPHHEVANALAALFGPAHRFSFPGSLPDHAHLKRTFHRRSLAAHPDRARTLGRRAETLTREFQDLNEAYRLLLPLITASRPGAARSARGRTSSRPSQMDDFFWTMKTPPPVPLKFAQYVYYRGRISFQNLIRALVRQMTDRPRVGDLAVDCGLLTRPALNSVLAHRVAGEPFLKAAVRLGCLNNAAARRVLLRQRACNLPIGAVLVREGLLAESVRDSLLTEFLVHNRRYAARAAS
jgi:hypothetical protein